MANNTCLYPIKYQLMNSSKLAIKLTSIQHKLNLSMNHPIYAFSCVKICLFSSYCAFISVIYVYQLSVISIAIMSTSNNQRNLLFPKRSWTEEEDEQLEKLVKHFGPHNWSQIAKYVPHRLSKQCRQRWVNHLDPNIRHEEWSDNEEWLLYVGHEMLGNRWSKIARMLPGRTDNSLKNHWNSIMKRKMPQLVARFEREKKYVEQSQNQKEILVKILGKYTHVNDLKLEDEVKSFKTQQKIPELSLKESSKSSSLNFSNLLNQIDQKDNNIQLERSESYQYTLPNCIKPSRSQQLRQKQESLKTIAEKENNNYDIQKFLEEQSLQYPLPLTLKRLSSYGFDHYLSRNHQEV